MKHGQRPIYHLTHVKNLDGILAQGRLWSHNEAKREGIVWASIAYEHIQARRAAKPVTCPPGGNLHDYVPWFFGPRPPMLLPIHRNRVPGYSEGQTPIVHLVSRIGRVEALGRPFIFTNVHPPLIYADFYNTKEDLDKVDWDIMTRTWWNNTDDDPDRKSRRGAEFLVHRYAPWEAVESIGVANADIKADVESRIAKSTHRPPVEVQRGWYYG